MTTLNTTECPYCHGHDCPECDVPTQNTMTTLNTIIEEERGMELILKVLPHLILGNAEELYNNPDGEMAKNTISEMQRVIRETHHQQLQKVREEEVRLFMTTMQDRANTIRPNLLLNEIVNYAHDRLKVFNHSELDQLNK